MTEQTPKQKLEALVNKKQEMLDVEQWRPTQNETKNISGKHRRRNLRTH